VACDRGQLILFTGHEGLFALGHYLMTWRLIEGEAVVLIDSANVFDLPFITKAARALQMDARRLLKRIFISRAFTIHQLEAVVQDRLAGKLRACDSRLCFVSGLLDGFWDEEVPLWEAAPILQRVVHWLRSLADQGNRIIILAPDSTMLVGKRKGLVSIAVRSADRVFTLCRSEKTLILKDDAKGTRGKPSGFLTLPFSKKRYPGR
jgi:hypothetical protein